jgi:aspartate/methionine/tyrosine aminotransferase
MRIQPFGVEIWMNAHETRCALNLAETCVESLTVSELLGLAGLGGEALGELLPLKLTYGAIAGSERLRRAIAALYEKQAPENVVVAHGAAGANMLAHQALVSAGERVVSLVPNYQQHTAIPESFGADVRLVHLKEENGFLPDLAELRELAGPGTKLIALSNPNNPTGALMGRAVLEEIAGIAEASGAWVLADEVYRGIDQEGPGFTASVADLYAKGVSTGSMSKAYSLAGLRLGWIAGPPAVVEAVSLHRDYSTISVGLLDDHLAALALENAEAVLARSRRITRENLAALSDWVDAEPAVSWVRPRSGTTALLRYDLAMPSEEFCLKLLAETGVLVVPGSCFGVERSLRIGFANNADALREGLKRLSAFLGKERRRRLAA